MENRLVFVISEKHERGRNTHQRRDWRCPWYGGRVSLLIAVRIEYFVGEKNKTPTAWYSDIPVRLAWLPCTTSVLVFSWQLLLCSLHV